MFRKFIDYGIYCIEISLLFLNFKQVVVGKQIVVPAYSIVSLCPQPSQLDSDEELEYVDSNAVVVETPCGYSFSFVINSLCTQLSLYFYLEICLTIITENLLQFSFFIVSNKV